jgi:hypothetical protein
MGWLNFQNTKGGKLMADGTPSTEYQSGTVDEFYFYGEGEEK